MSFSFGESNITEFIDFDPHSCVRNSSMSCSGYSSDCQCQDGDSDLRKWAATTLPLSPPPALRSPERVIIIERLINNRRRLQSLLLEAKLLQDKIHQDAATSAPIRLVPAEVLSHVFQYVAREESHYFVFRLMAHKMPSHAIMHVCRQWRSVATATPDLWGTVDIQVWMNDTVEPIEDECNLRRWLSLSKSTPLDITFYIQERLEWGYSYLNVLYKHLSRWQSFNYSGPPGYLIPLFRDDIPAIKLVSLEVNSASTDKDSTSSFMRCWFAELKYLCLSGAAVGILDNILVPMLSVLRLDHCRLPSDYLRTLCQNSPLLEKLVFFGGVQLEGFPSSNALFFPRLKTLECTVTHDSRLDLRFFHASPQLKTTIILDHRCMRSIIIGPMLSVTVLELDTYTKRADTIFKFFKHFPNLKRLGIRFRPASHHRKTELAAVITMLSEIRPVVCPQLGFLTIRSSHIDGKPICALSRSRDSLHCVRGQDVTVARMLVTLSDCFNMPEVTDADYARLRVELGITEE